MEQHDEMPILVRPPLEQQPQVIDLHAPGTTAEPPTPEQIRAAEAAFGRQEKESHAAEAVMALWAAGMVLPDLMRDLTQPDEEEEEPRKKNRIELPRD